jgi:hypothetical protein
MIENSRLGEVVEANSSEFFAQCYKLFNIPPLGSLIRTSDGEQILFAVVSFAQTLGIEPGRRPIARGQNTMLEEDLYRDNPHLLQLLKSEFSAVVIGFKDSEETIHYHLPPRPARLHGFVFMCSNEEVREFSASFNFLRILTNSTVRLGDELIGSTLRQMSMPQDEPKKYLLKAAKKLSRLLAHDLNRLNVILERIR